MAIGTAMHNGIEFAFLGLREGGFAPNSQICPIYVRGDVFSGQGKCRNCGICLAHP
jgi:hypothetical protein